MRIHYMKANLILILALALAPIGAVAAQGAGLEPCPGSQVSGTVVAVDVETGIVTIDRGAAGLCTVTVGGDFDHPIVALLGSFFGEVSAENLAAALLSGDLDTLAVEWTLEEGTVLDAGDQIASLHE